MILGSSLRLWGLRGYKIENCSKKLQQLRFLVLPGAKSRLPRKTSNFWSTVWRIGVLRAIMPNLSKIGLILSKGGRTGFARSAFYLYFGIWPSLNPYISTQRKDISTLVNSFVNKVLESNHAKFEQNGATFEQGGEQVLPGRHFWKSHDLTSLAPPLDGGVRGLPKITLGKSPFSLVYKGENRMALFVLVLEKLKFFCGKTAFSLSFPLEYIASYALAGSTYRNHLLSCVPLLNSYFFSPAFFHSFHSTRSQ